MTGHLTSDTMTRYGHNELSAEELLTLDEHLKECRECRDRAASADLAAPVASALLGVTPSMHLTYEELEGVADGSLSPESLTRVDVHASGCSDCRAEIASFRALAASEETVASASYGFFEQVRAAFARPLVPITAAFVLLIGVGVAVWVATRARPSEIDANFAAAKVAGENDNTKPASVVAEDTPAAADQPESEAEKPAELEFALSDGGRTVGLDAAGNLVGFDAAPLKYRSLLKESLRDQKLPAADVSDLRSKPAATMGTAETGEAFKVVGPVGRVVETTTPSLRWQPMRGAEAYVVEIYDQNYNKVASSGRIANNSWTPRLERGRTYVWQVTALKDGREIMAPQRPAREARFRILDAKRSAEIAALKRGSNSSPLLLALAYSEAGLFAAAEREMQRVIAANPRSPLARKFLAQMKVHQDVLK